jgi:beta-lactam-binding protein with PASTA domain
VAIVIGCIVVFITIILLTRFAYRRYNKAKKMVPLLDSSLAEEADLEQEEVERVSEWRINESVRGSV